MYCSSLTSVTIGSSVTTIEKAAFIKCSNLTNVHCKCSSPPSLPNGTFDSHTQLKGTLYVPYGSLSNYKKNFNWNSFKQIVEE